MEEKNIKVLSVSFEDNRGEGKGWRGTEREIQTHIFIKKKRRCFKTVVFAK